MHRPKWTDDSHRERGDDAVINIRLGEISRTDSFGVCVEKIATAGCWPFATHVLPSRVGGNEGRTGAGSEATVRALLKRGADPHAHNLDFLQPIDIAQVRRGNYCKGFSDFYLKAKVGNYRPFARTVPRGLGPPWARRTSLTSRGPGVPHLQENAPP